MEQLDADSKAQLHAAEYVDEAAIAPLTRTINLNELATADFRAKVQLGALGTPPAGVLGAFLTVAQCPALHASCLADGTWAPSTWDWTRRMNGVLPQMMRSNRKPPADLWYNERIARNGQGVPRQREIEEG